MSLRKKALLLGSVLAVVGGISAAEARTSIYVNTYPAVRYVQPAPIYFGSYYSPPQPYYVAYATPSHGYWHKRHHRWNNDWDRGRGHDWDRDRGHRRHHN